jgi:hypothetical protein
MARVLHLLPRDGVTLAATVIRRDVEAGDEVAVALVGAGAAPPVPAGVTVHRVPSDWSYDELLERIFDADRVITW